MTQPASSPSMNPVALSSYAVAICSFAAAPLAFVFKDFPGIGLAAVGGFYLAVGTMSHVLTASKTLPESAHGIGGHTSGADNLVAEAMSGSRETASARKPELVGSAR